MATFSIYQDQENNSCNLANKLKDSGPLHKRSVLRDVNKNSEEGNEGKLPAQSIIPVDNSDEVFCSQRSGSGLTTCYRIFKNSGAMCKERDVLSKKSVNSSKTKDERINFNDKQYLNGKIANQKPKSTKTAFQNTQIVEKGFKIYQENSGELSHREIYIDKVAIKYGNKSRVLKDKCVESEIVLEKEISFPTCVTALHKEPSVSSSSSCMSLQEQYCETEYVTQDLLMSIDNSKSDSSLKLGFAAKVNELCLNERLYGCDEYRSEISAYLRVLQHEHRPNKNYMRKQPDITHGMRAILVDWLVEVVEEYGMKTETLYLAVNYIDRFLSWMRVVRAKLQLVGTSAMFIASKFEEIYPPNVNDFVFITNDTYTKKQVLRMEHLILKVLSFDLSSPTTLCFLADFTSNYPTPEKVKFLAMYLCELALLEADPYLSFLPSEIAASAFVVARYNLQDEVCEDIFPEKLQRTVDHHIEDLIDCIFALDNTFKKASNIPQKAIQEKYKSNKYQNVASVEPIEEDCSAYLVRKYSLSLLKGIKKLNNCSESRTH